MNIKGLKGLVEALYRCGPIIRCRITLRNSPAFSSVGVARAIALQSRTSQGADADSVGVQALAAYHDFQTLWKDADLKSPLKQAKGGVREDAVFAVQKS